ncbi:MAG: antibiotic biosynthesis monooxygenase [Tannerellaceae bacterium]|nr:antibiotic biosynthesis monooxygenase [Tannerellaceae bacterium]
MIKIVAKATVKEGKREEFIRVVQPMITGSQAEEGNISYNLFEDLDDKNTLTFIEEWKDLAAIDTHNNSAHFQAGVSAISDLIEGIEIRKYQLIG